MEALLGEGGMGRVYRAKDSRLERFVALKILRTRVEGESEGSTSGSGRLSDGPARLLREARAAAALDHPNAVSIFDVGECDGTPYIAMELVLGRALRAYVGEPGVPLDRRVRWLVDVAHALGAAHARGLVHRDIKPENVMVRDDGVVKVLDFGIARRLDLKVDAPALTSPSTLSGSGLLLGTPQYMSPEQLRGEPVDGRADQFAWGVVAYELLTGAPPWDAHASGINLILEILSKDPAPFAVSELPPAVEATVRKALSKSPRDRFALMEDLIVALEPHGSSVREARALATTERPPPGDQPDASLPRASTVSNPVDVPPPRPAPARRSRWIVPAIACALGAALVVALARREPSTSPAVLPSASLAPPRLDPPPQPAATAITDLPPPKTPSLEASAAFRSGLHGIRDASMMMALASFQRAIAADPAMASAHARLVWMYASQGASAAARSHLQSARELRSALDERDQAMLDAIEPVVLAEPPDRAETERRLARASAKWPGDAELAFVLGRFRQTMGVRAAATEAFDRALANDPKFAMVWWARAIDGEDAGDFDAALAAYDRCVEVSPAAASCLRSRATIHAQRGACDLVASDAQRMIRVEPHGHRPYEWLARALAARGEPREAIKEALRQRWAAYPDADRKKRELADLAGLDVLFGDFASAETRALELDRIVSADKNEIEHAEPARLLVAIYGELGDVKRAGLVGEDFRKRREAWISMGPLRDGAGGGDNALSVFPSLLAASRRAGLLSTEAFETKRAAWLEAARSSSSPLSERELWVPAYGAPAETPDEAREALLALPRYSPLPSPRAFVPADATAGKVQLLGGHADLALPLLRRGVATCLVLDQPIVHTRAHWFLGQALEAKGDVAGACAAYGVVLARWSAPKPRSITAEAAKARSRALGCH